MLQHTAKYYLRGTGRLQPPNRPPGSAGARWEGTNVNPMATLLQNFEAALYTVLHFYMRRTQSKAAAKELLRCGYGPVKIEPPGIGPQILVSMFAFTRATHFGVALFLTHSHVKVDPENGSLKLNGFLREYLQATFWRLDFQLLS